MVRECSTMATEESRSGCNQVKEQVLKTNQGEWKSQYGVKVKRFWEDALLISMRKVIDSSFWEKRKKQQNTKE